MDAKQSRSLSLLALLLSAVAGGVDALGWMTLDHVFTSHMSGNTVGLSVYFAALTIESARTNDLRRRPHPVRRESGRLVGSRLGSPALRAVPLALLVLAIFLDRSLARAGISGAGPEEG